MEILEHNKAREINRLIYKDPVKFADIMLGVYLHKRQVHWVQNATKMINILRPGNRWGKLQPITEPVLTPLGYRPIGEIGVGDLVFTQSGKPTKVIGVYPQGKKQCYRFIFDDGSYTDSGEEHLWLVKTSSNRFRKNYNEKGKEYKNSEYGKRTVLTTREIREMYQRSSSPKQRVSIPVVEPIRFEKKEYELSPYGLGLLLGDGGLRTGVILSTSDPEVLGEFKEYTKVGEYDYRIHGVVGIIKRLGLYGKYSYEKHIPQEYLYGSVMDRISLLQGLMDTDGSIEKSGKIEFSTTSKELADGVRFLIHSLGGKCVISSRVTTFTYKGVKKDGRISYRLRFRIPGVCPFRLKRKKELWKEKGFTTDRILLRIEDVGILDSVCIEVEDSSHLYVTRDCIVTHNTVVAGVKHGWQCMCKPNLEGKIRTWRDWYKAEYQTLNFGPTYELGRGALLTLRDMVQGSFLILVCPKCDSHRIESEVFENKIHYRCEECKEHFTSPNSRTNKSMLTDWAITNDKSESNVLPFIEFRTGAKVLGRSYSEMGVAFKMKALAYISGDECADIAELWTFTNNTLLPRLISLRGTMDLVGTPQPEGHDYMRMIEMAEEDMKRKDWSTDGLFFTQRGSMFENTFLPRETIQALERISDPAMRKQIIEGEHVESGDKYFGYDRIQNAVDQELQMIEVGVPERKYITTVDFSGGESVWADYTVILVVDYTEEPYKVVHFKRFKGGDVPIPMQYRLVEEVYTNFKGHLIIDSSALGGKNALAYLGHLNPISFDTLPKPKSEMLATLKIAFDGGQSEKRKRFRIQNEKGQWEDQTIDWGLIRIPNIPVLVNELTNYRTDDTKLKTDCVMALGMAIHWIEMRRPKKLLPDVFDLDFLLY